MSRSPSPNRESSTGSPPLLDEAVKLHQAGRTAEAAAIYEKIRAATPDHFDATHLLGVIALQEGRLDAAESLIETALRINPRDAAARNNLGTVHLRKHDFDRAREQFERLVQAQPNSMSALTNLGTALRQLGRPREALIPLRRAHAAEPRSTVICNLLGACLLDTGDAHAAASCFEEATRANPDDPDGWSNLGVALNSIGEVDRARECAEKAVAMRPGSSDALASLAAVEFEEGRLESAIATYTRALMLPGPSVQTLCAFGNALWTSGRCDEALDRLRQAVALDGNYAVARWKLAMSNCRTYYETAADVERSREAFAQSLDELRAWFRAAPRPEAHAAVGATQPFYIAYQPFNNRELLSRYGSLCSEWMASIPRDVPAREEKGAQRAPCASPDEGRIRIGIASAHIRDHSVWNAITKGWVGNLDKARFDVWLFQLGRMSDEETSRAKRNAAHYEDRPKNLAAWIRAIGDARLDVLVYPDIGMDALTTQLASLRLAPVQAATWGHAETTGLPTMDLYISAEALEPPGAEGNYTERLVRLPGLGVCVEPLRPSAADVDLASLGLPGDEPLLLCPGTPFKYSPMHDHVWARIARGLRPGGASGRWSRLARRLRGAGNGRLVFFGSGNSHMDRLLAQRLRGAFDDEKADYDARVVWVPYLDRRRFFGLMQRAALMLDTVGFSGFNNALQAAEAGLPLLAREGPFMRGRLASGIMRRMGLPELVAGTDDAFIETAVELAMDGARLQELRGRIAECRNVLFNDVEPVRALERCLIEAVGDLRRP